MPGITLRTAARPPVDTPPPSALLCYPGTLGVVSGVPGRRFSLLLRNPSPLTTHSLKIVTQQIYLLEKTGDVPLTRCAAPLTLVPVVARVEEVEGGGVLVIGATGAATRPLVEGREGAGHVCCGAHPHIRASKPTVFLASCLDHLL